MIKSKWFNVFRCEHCHRQMSFNEVVCSHGICPHCGHISGTTICDVYMQSARLHFKSRIHKLFGITCGHDINPLKVRNLTVGK